MDKIFFLEKEINKIKDRNSRVELDKAWETSYIRKILVAILTYIVVLSFFILVGINKPFLSAIVPTLGFLLSTFSLNYFKNLWIQKRINKK